MGNTPLHLAAANGHATCVRLLLEKGANLTSRNAVGETPLHVSAFNGHFHCMLLLLVESSDPASNSNIKDNNGLLKIQFANSSGKTALHKCIENCNVSPSASGSNASYECAEKLLGMGKADANAQDSLCGTPLHIGKTDRWFLTWLAVKKGSRPILKLLLNHNVNIDAQNNDGDTGMQKFLGLTDHQLFISLRWQAICR